MTSAADGERSVETWRFRRATRQLADPAPGLLAGASRRTPARRPFGRCAAARRISFRCARGRRSHACSRDRSRHRPRPRSGGAQTAPTRRRGSPRVAELSGASDTAAGERYGCGAREKRPRSRSHRDARRKRCGAAALVQASSPTSACRGAGRWAAGTFRAADRGRRACEPSGGAGDGQARLRPTSEARGPCRAVGG